jgi:hypothetical protein
MLCCGQARSPSASRASSPPPLRKPKASPRTRVVRSDWCTVNTTSPDQRPSRCEQVVCAAVGATAVESSADCSCRPAPIRQDQPSLTRCLWCQGPECSICMGKLSLPACRPPASTPPPPSSFPAAPLAPVRSKGARPQPLRREHRSCSLAPIASATAASRAPGSTSARSAARRARRAQLAPTAFRCLFA